MEPNLHILLSEADWWEGAGYVADGVVILGIVIESYELYQHIRAGKLRQKIVEFVGVGLVVLGLSLEIMAQVQSNRRTGIVITELNKQAQEARLELAKVKAPRTLTLDRQRFVAEAIRVCGSQRYSVALSQAADDALDFWASLHSAIEAGGWTYLPPPPRSLTIGRPPAGVPIVTIPGVEIVFDPSLEQRLLPCALALGNALHADGMVVAVNRDIQSNPNESDRDILLIRIGARVPRL